MQTAAGLLTWHPFAGRNSHHLGLLLLASFIAPATTADLRHLPRLVPPWYPQGPQRPEKGRATLSLPLPTLGKEDAVSSAGTFSSLPSTNDASFGTLPVTSAETELPAGVTLAVAVERHFFCRTRRCLTASLVRLCTSRLRARGLARLRRHYGICRQRFIIGAPRKRGFALCFLRQRTDCVVQ